MEEMQAYELGELATHTTNENGDRIILGFDGESGRTTIALPTADASNLLSGIMAAVGRAEAVRTRKASRALVTIRSFEVQNQVKDGLPIARILVLGLPGGGHIHFRIDEQSARRFAELFAQTMGILSPGTSDGPLS